MTISKTYVKILRGGIFISLFLPLVIFSQYLSPFHFGKMIVFRILVELMAVFYILLILIDKRYRPRWTCLLISFSIFTFLYIFSGIVGVDFYQSLWGTLERMGGIFSFVHFWVYFVILTSIIKTKEDWHKILKISVFVGFLSILFAYGQRLRLGSFFVGWQHGERVIGTIGNPALFAGYLLFVLYLAILFLLKTRTNMKEKGFYAAVLILGIPVLLMTAVRGAIISFFVSLFLLGIFFIFASKNRAVKTSLLVVIFIFLILTIGVWINRDKAWVKNISWLDRVINISKDTSTVQTRLWSWKSAIQGWKEKPIFGWGPENFTFLHMKYFDPRHFTHIGAETIWDRAHNVPLDTLATMGVVGFLSYLSIFFFIFYTLIKKFKTKKIGKITLGVLSAMLIAYFGQDLFIFDTFANYFMFFLVLGYINFLIPKKKNLSPEAPPDGKIPSIFLTIILLIVAFILVYVGNIKPAQANYACTRAILLGRTGDIQKTVDKYQQAINYNTPQGAYEIRHKLAGFTIQFTESQRQKNKEIDTSLLYYTIKKVSDNIEKFPLDTTPYLFIGRMYILLIDKDGEAAGEQALAAINKALDLNRKNPRIWYELGQAQLSLKRYQDSYNSFKTAVELNPQVGTSWWFLGTVAYQAGKYEEAVADIEKAIELKYSDYKNSIVDLMRMVKIYEKVGNYEKIVEVYELAIQEQPKNAQLYASLAVSYAKVGKYQDAVQAALKSAEIDPKFKAEAEKFINSLPKQELNY